MANMQPKQSADHREELVGLMNGYLAERGWSPARLAKESGQSKATICRLTNFKSGNPQYRPSMRTIQAIALALKLSREQRKKLFDTAFPEFRVWEAAAEQGYTVDETNDILYEKGLPLLTTER